MEPVAEGEVYELLVDNIKLPKKVKLTRADLPEQERELADLIGFKNVCLLITAMGGSAIYIKRWERIKNIYRDKWICNEFDGRNIKELSDKYRVSEARIRGILHKCLNGRRNRIHG